MVSGTKRTVAWRKDDPFGVEFAEVRFATHSLRAAGVAVGTDPEPYRLDYEPEMGDGFITTRLHVTARGEGWHRALDLRRSPSGDWSVDTRIEGEGRSMAPAGGEVEHWRGSARLRPWTVSTNELDAGTS